MANNETSIIISAVDKTASTLKGISSNLDQVGSEVTRLQGAFAGFAAVAGVGLFATMIQGAINAADELNDLNKKTGIAVEQLAGLKLAAQQSGGDLNGTADAINKLSKNIGENAEKYAKIGVTAKEPLEAFKQLSEVFSRIEDPQKRAAFGAEALGKSWSSAAPLLAEGAENIQKMVDKGTALSGVTKSMALDADQFNDAVAEIGAALGGMATRVAADLLPVLLAAGKNIGDVSDNAHDMNGAFSPLAETFRAVVIMGGNVAFVFKSMAIEIGGMAAQVSTLISAAFAKTPAEAAAALKAAGSIGDAMKADAAKARSAFDAWEAGVMNAAQATRATTEETKKQTAAQSSAVSGFISTGKAATKTAEAFDPLIARYEEMARIFKALDAEIKAAEKTNEEYARNIAALIDPLEQEAAALEQQAENYGRTRAEIEATTIARLEEARAIMAANGASAESMAYYEREIEARKRIAAASNSLDAKKANKDAAQNATKEWEKAAEAIERSLTDALMRGFESGKTFGENFKTTLENLFKTMILRPVIQGVVQGGLNAVGLGAPGSSGGLSGAANAVGTAKNIYGLYQDGIAGSVGNFASTAGNLIGSESVSAFGTGMQAAGTGFDVTGAISAYEAAGMGNVASSLASGYSLGGGVAGTASLASTAVGSGIVGGAGTIGLPTGVSSAVGAIGGGTIGGVAAGGSTAAAGSSLASTIGAAMPYVAIAAVVASALGVFGKKKPKPPVMNIVNVPDEYETSWTSMDTSFGKIIGAAKHYKDFASVFESMKPMAELDKVVAAQLSPEEITKATADIAHRGTGEFKPNGDVMEDFFMNRLDWITDSVGGWANDLAETFVGSLGDTYTISATLLGMRKNKFAETLATQMLGDPEAAKAFAKDGEQLAMTFLRLAGALEPVNQVLGDLNLTLFESNLAGAAAAAQLSDAFGGIETLQKATAAYYAGFYSDAEKLEVVRKAVSEQFATLGETMPQTREGFRDLVESLDLTTSAGATTFAGLMALAPAFGQVADAAKAANEAMRGTLISDSDAAVDTAYAALERAVEAEKAQLETAYAAQEKTWQQSIDASSEIRDNLRDLATSLENAVKTVVVESGALTMSRRVAAQGTLNTALSAAESGQSLRPFAAGINAAIDDLSKPAADLYASLEDYTRAQGEANGVLVKLQRSTIEQMSVAEMTLKAIEDSSALAAAQHQMSISRLDQTLVAAQQQIDALRGIETGVQSVADAMLYLASSISTSGTLRTALPPTKPKSTVPASNSIIDAYQSILGRAPDESGMVYWSQQAASGMSSSDIASAISNSTENQVQNIYESVLGREADAGGASYWSGLIDSGMSIADVTAAIQNSDEYRNSHATGLERVPYDGYKATLHAGEAVVDAQSTQAISRYFGGGGSNNAALVAEIKALREEVILLRSEARATAVNTGKTARAMDRVMPDGDAIQTRAATV